MKTFSQYLMEDLVWVFDNGGEYPSGPYSSRSEAEKDIKIIMSRNSAGERNDCSEPYQIDREKLKDLQLAALDDSELCESMNEKQKKEFYARLQTHKVRFQYYKKNGDLRKAYGTLIPEELPKENSSETRQEATNRRKRKFPFDSVFYYDLGEYGAEEGYKSFKMANFDKYLD